MSSARTLERAHLAEAERHIANGERVVSGQIVLIERLRAEGRDAALAEKLLLSLQGALDQHREHRRLILQRLALPEAGPS